MKTTFLQSLMIVVLAAALADPSAVRAQDEALPGGPTVDQDQTTSPSLDSAPGSPVYEPAPAPLNNEPAPVYDSAPGSPVSDTTDNSSRRSKMDKPLSYVLLKGGVYSPSDDFDVDNIHIGRRSGGAAELAVGHYFLPMLAVELGAGYFQSRNSPAAAPGTMLRVVPIVATGKLLIPIGIFEPYGLFGIGGYISDLDVSGNVSNFSGSTEITFGYHAGVGFNIDLHKNMFVGAEGKYLWAEPEFGGRPIRLDGFITTVNVGFRF